MTQDNSPLYAIFPLVRWEAIDLVVRRMDEPGLTRSALARLAGVSPSTLYRIIRAAGGRIDHARSMRQEQWRDTVRKLWPDHTGKEIERITGGEIRANRAKKIARELSLSHSPETLRRIALQWQGALSQAHRPEVVARRAAKWKATRRLDELRVLACEPQRTRFRFRTEPRGAAGERYQLRHRYGYFTLGPDLRTLYYDAQTRRRHAAETRATRRYGFRFLPADTDTQSIPAPQLSIPAPAVQADEGAAAPRANKHKRLPAPAPPTFAPVNT